MLINFNVIELKGSTAYIIQINAGTAEDVLICAM